MKTESGFSLTELMTALTIGSIVVSFCYATFSFGEMVYSNYVKKTDAADLASRTAQRIASDIRSAKTVIMEPDSAVFIIGSGGKHVGYRFSNGRVTRDSVSFNDNPAVRLEASVTTKASRYRVLVVVTTGSGVYRAGVETQSLQSSAASFGERGRNAGTR